MPVSPLTIEQTGAKQVEISGVDEKRQITAVFAASPVGKLLPLQLICQDKKPACLPTFKFPSDWNVTYAINR